MCKFCNEKGHFVANCPAAKANKGRPKIVDNNLCTACGMFHHVVNCAAVRTWLNKVDGTQISLQLLRGVVVPDNSCIVEDFDLDTHNARMVAGLMYQKHHKRYGAFVVRPKLPLTSRPVSTLHGLTIHIFDKN